MFSFANDDFLILAHRGASQIFPENTLLSMRGALGTEAADYLEMDLQLTKDYVLVVFHDKYLNDVTDVKKKFTKHRARKDGKYYVVDFTYAELQNLKITSRYYKILGFRKNLTKSRNYEKYYYCGNRRYCSAACSRIPRWIWSKSSRFKWIRA